MAKATTTTETPAETEAGTPVTVTDVVRPTLPADAYLREQEKGESDPVSDPVEPGAKAEPVTVGKNQPYPTGGAK